VGSDGYGDFAMLGSLGKKKKKLRFNYCFRP
jgi:hypothetical protein